jgi:hypothetical protein
VSPDIREVAAAVLLNGYWHVHAAELILEGAEPREANEACWKTYYFGTLKDFARSDTGLARPGTSRVLPESITRTLHPTGEQSLTDPLVAVPDTGPHKHWTTRCLVAALEQDERLLVTRWDVISQHYGDCARARIPGGYVRSLQWQCRMMWLLATGAGDLLHCARVAYDRATGRPSRKRRPADPEWLAAELDSALTATWDALRNADNGGGRPFWRIAPSPVRPRADDEELLAHATYMTNLIGQLWGQTG